VGFSKFSSRSLEAVARAVERDEVFRRRVADAVDEEQVGRAGWLWLARPEGWRDQLDALEATAAAEAADLEEQRAERAASKQLVAVQEAVRRADAQVAAQMVELEELRAQLIQEREARAGAEVRAEELAERIDAVTAARSEVVRNLKDTEARLVERATEAKAAKARIRILEGEAEAAARERRKPAGSGAADGPAPSAPSGGEGVPTPTTPLLGGARDAGRAPASGTGVGQAPGSHDLPSPNAGGPADDDEAARRGPAAGVDSGAPAPPRALPASPQP
jgi:multidrug efflux pump subunit AcrA (membrane-fusion protein)